jgi:hypothetical protein
MLYYRELKNIGGQTMLKTKTSTAVNYLKDNQDILHRFLKSLNKFKNVRKIPGETTAVSYEGYSITDYSEGVHVVPYAARDEIMPLVEQFIEDNNLLLKIDLSPRAPEKYKVVILSNEFDDKVLATGNDLTLALMTAVISFSRKL